ncbi:MAG: nucleotidyltransferase family protein [Candidatus Brocadiaceae bacterium]|nr:nucleotidyltransferase family protein [Candidatus Brocadiaceae bacterium]
MSKNKVLIMCGGRGKRLGNLTESIPKPLIEIGGKTILEMKFDNYMSQGFKDFILCIGYKGGLIEEAIEKFNFPINCKFSDEGEPAGILKRLNAAKDLFEEKVILTYGDTFTDIKLSLLSEIHEKSDNEATIVVAPIQNPFGLVEFDNRGKVTYFKEKPILNYYIGYAVINKAALELIPQKIIDMPDGEGLITFYRILMAMEKLGTFYHSGLQITFNTEDELKDVRKKIADFYTTKENT